MSLYQMQYKDLNGNIITLPLNAVKLGGETLQQIKDLINTKGTVTSVQVQAGTGLSSSVNTAQSTTLNTTISIANGYKLPTTSEWSSKADDTGVVHKTGDIMTGQLVAQNNIAYTTAQVRNVILSTSEPTSSDGGNGDIWIVYAD